MTAVPGAATSAATMQPFVITDDLPTASLALEASAGTGKTWTLTSLAVRYIAERDIALPDLLLVTFTRAATAELRQRVRARVGEALAEAEDALANPADAYEPSDEVLRCIVGEALASKDGGEELRVRRDRLQQAAQQLDEATISTIHGFCQRMLQHAALEAGVDFDAVLLDDDADLLAEIVDDHMARTLRDADAAWVRYLQDAAKVSRATITALARAVAGMPQLRLQPDHAATPGPPWAPWREALAEFRVIWEDGGREEAVALVAELKGDGTLQPGQQTFTENKAEKRAAEIDDWLQGDHRYPRPLERKDLHLQFAHPYAMFTPAALSAKAAEGAAFPDHRVLDAATRLLAAATAPATIYLHRAATYLWQELDARKRQRTVLTFDDLLRRLADALGDATTREAVRAAIRQRYRVALIDEFQDTDPVQWRIFRALFATDEPFILIGDPKQAIYAFRGADIHTYVDARDTRPQRRTLQRNFRSDRGYVDACNRLFDQPGAFATDDIPYHPVEAAHADRLADPSGGAALQLRFIPRDLGELSDRSPNKNLLLKGWSNRVLPDDVAGVAVALLTDGLTIDRPTDGKGQTRPEPLAPRDLAVLVRTNRRAEAIQRALHRAGVPAVIQRGGSVFTTEEAGALQRLLAAMLRPSMERAAVSAAATILFGRDAPTLVAQRDALDGTGNPDGSDEPDEPQADARAWDRWIDALTRWGERWHRDGLLPAIRAAFADETVPERLLATPEGERRLTNVRHLVELLHTAETTEGLPPHALVDWLRTQRADAADGDRPTAETELRLEADAEAVRIVTIHGSKGLQYPVVLCPDLWDGRIRVDEALTRFHDPTIDDAWEAITLDLDVDARSPAKERAIALARADAQTEQLRLAYVALTRAQHRCIVWWGAFTDGQTSPLASLLHGSAPGGVADAPGDRLTRGNERIFADDDALRADLEAICATSGGAIAVHDVEALHRNRRWDAGTPPTPKLAARTFTRRDIDRTWRRTSFTSLVRNASDHVAEDPRDGRDVDAEVDADVPAEGVTPEPLTTESPAVLLATFPRGAGPGTFLHDVLERADLTALDDTAAMTALLEDMERRHGIDPVHREQVLGGLRAAVATPLGPVAGDARLSDLAVGDRLNELRFELPLGGGYAADRAAFTLRQIADLLEGSDDLLLVGYADRLRDPALQRQVRGFLNGSIDLLARLPDGRFLVADYKSNWLGDRGTARSVAEHYRPDALTAAMSHHHYVLQALLYLVAAHRYLRWRVADYDYDTHVAGGAYLFLRGMVGAHTPRVDGQPCGVAALRPDGALIVALSRLLDGGAT